MCSAYGQFKFPQTLAIEDSLTLAKSFKIVENAVNTDSLVFLFKDSSFCSHFKYKYLYGCIYHEIVNDLIWGLPHPTVVKMKTQILRSPNLIYCNEIKQNDSVTFGNRLSSIIEDRLIHDSLILNFNLLYSIDKGNSQKYFNETRIYYTKAIDSLFYSDIFIFSPDGKVYKNVLSKYSMPEFNNISEFRYNINNKKLTIEIITLNGREVVRYLTTYRIKKRKLVFLNYSTTSSRKKPGKYTILSLYKI
jgi:hypothetical protein